MVSISRSYYEYTVTPRYVADPDDYLPDPDVIFKETSATGSDFINHSVPEQFPYIFPDPDLQYPQKKSQQQ
jgi:hypothetical protein